MEIENKRRSLQRFIASSFSLIKSENERIRKDNILIY